jgi:hypothetical protein
MSATAIQSDYSENNKVMLKVKRNTKCKKPILINTLIPNFEFTNAQNAIVKPDTLLKI